MKWGILFRWGSWWIGGHWSDHNKRLCVNPVPMITVWITAEGGETPDMGYGFDIYRSDKHQPNKSITIPNGWVHHMIEEFIKPALAQMASEKIERDAREQLLASQEAKLEQTTMNTTEYNRLTESQHELAVADKIMQLVHAEFPNNSHSQMSAIWLAFQALYSPRDAGIALESYRVIRPDK